LLGLILGKAVFENIIVAPQFSPFFLSFATGRYAHLSSGLSDPGISSPLLLFSSSPPLLAFVSPMHLLYIYPISLASRYNFMNVIDDLASLDADLYRNLIFLRRYEGDVSALCLTFAVSDAAFGAQKEIELVPGGGDIEVTARNRHRYIALVAKYYLHDRIASQAKAFFKGVHTVVPSQLFALFSAPELHVLVSGTEEALDLSSLQANCRVAGGFLGTSDPYLRKLWAVLAALDDDDKRRFLRFVTACERPPVLGFSALNPLFCVQVPGSNS
jgi:ubiquitin-protein ligase E3 C